MDSDSSHELEDEIESKEGITQKDKDGNSMINDYITIKPLGRGSSAKVKLYRLNDELYAGKIFRKSVLSNKRSFIPDPTGEIIVTTGISDLSREIAIMKKLTHKNVVKLKEVIFDENTDKMYLMMDYCEKGPVMDFDEDMNKYYFPWTDQPLTEIVLRKIFRDTVCGLEYLHYQNIAHRDIKPQNMLLTNNFEVKLADFGQSHLFSDVRMTNRSLGTCFFYPPESCGDIEEFLPKPTDIWALGITFYTILFEKLPFECDSEYSIFETIRNFTLEFPEDRPIDDSLKELIARMLDKNPETRISIFEVISNPWLNLNCNPLEPTLEKIELPTEGEITKAINNVQKTILAKKYGAVWRKKATSISKSISDYPLE